MTFESTRSRRPRPASPDASRRRRETPRPIVTVRTRSRARARGPSSPARAGAPGSVNVVSPVRARPRDETRRDGIPRRDATRRNESAARERRRRARRERTPSRRARTRGRARRDEGRRRRDAKISAPPRRARCKTVRKDARVDDERSRRAGGESEGAERVEACGFGVRSARAGHRVGSTRRRSDGTLSRCGVERGVEALERERVRGCCEKRFD